MCNMRRLYSESFSIIKSQNLYFFPNSKTVITSSYSKTVQKFSNKLKKKFNFHWNSFWKQFHAGLNIISPPKFVLFFQKIYVIS